jgi:uncharacterized protein YecT (DUF1311 family)
MLRGPMADTLMRRVLQLLMVSLLAASCSSGAKPAASRATTTTRPAVAPVQYDRSCEKTAQTQTAMNACVGSELSELQNQLRVAISEEKTVLAPSLVNAAQQAFDNYENSECTAVASLYQGGSIYPLIAANCDVRLTAQRIEQVRSDTRTAQP